MARWGVAIGRVSAVAVVVVLLTLIAHAGAADSAAFAPVTPAVGAAGGAYALALDRSTSPVVPGYVPFALFLVLETAAVLAWVLVYARRPSDGSESLVLCSRCARLHRRMEAFGRGADALAVGALAFLVALPFVAAGYESGFTFPNAVLAISAVAAVVAAAAEANYVARVAAARLWPAFTRSADPARIIGGGARWLGAILALYLFEPRDAGIAALFGDVGKRLLLDLPSTWTVMAAAAILAAACLVAMLARWLLPFVFGSLPTALAARREPHGTAG